MDNSARVKLATREDLFKILSFLDSHLPYYCDVHSTVLAALLTVDNATSYRVYFLEKDASGDDYSAVLGVEREIAAGKRVAWRLTEWSRDETALLKVLDEAINFIDWKNDIVFCFYRESYDERIGAFFEERNSSGVIDKRIANRYALEPVDALHFQLEGIPKEVYVKSLERPAAAMIYDLWAFKSTTTVEEVADEIDRMPSAGVFLKETDELVSWMMCHPFMGLSRAVTLEDHRRRGYASLAIRYLCKRMAQSGYLPYVTILPDNSASITLFEKMGFRFVKPSKSILMNDELTFGSPH